MKTMKKEYRKPEMKVYEIESNNILTSSLDYSVNNDIPEDYNDDML